MMIDRKTFTDVVSSVFGDRLGDLLSKISEGTVTEDFNLFFQNDTVFIIDTVNEEFISWYKLGHFGDSYDTDTLIDDLNKYMKGE